MPNYNISLTKDLAQIVTVEIKRKKYANRSEFFRDLIRRRYVINECHHSIEEIEPSEQDYRLIKKRKKNGKFIPLSTIRCLV